MKRLVIVAVDCADSKCEDCSLVLEKLRELPAESGPYACSMEVGCGDSFAYESGRGPLCLSGEKLLTQLFAVGNAMYMRSTDDRLAKEWVAAIEAVESFLLRSNIKV